MPLRLPRISRHGMWLQVRVNLTRAHHHLCSFLDAHRVQHDLLIARVVQSLWTANADHLRAVAVAERRHAGPLWIAAAVEAGGIPVGEKAREEFDHGRFEGREAGADDAYVHLEERPAVGDGLVI